MRRHTDAFVNGGTMSRKSLLSLSAATLLCFAFPTQSQELPEGKGKEIVLANCNSCHTFYSRVGAGYTAQGWDTVMRMMANHGITVPAEPLPTLMDYLTKNFPKTGTVTEYPMPDPEAKDPHTLIFDQSGILWFTVQNANRVGRLDPQTGAIKLLTPPTPKARPYGMAVNSKGTVFFVEFGTNKVGSVDPKTLEIREYPLPNPESRPRRITITSDDIVWYSDYSRGYLGRFDPATGKVTEWPSPSGPKSEPYGISAINDVIWYSESGTTPNTVVRFDPKAEKFQSWAIPGRGNIVRNTSVTRDGDFVLANSLVNAVTLVRIAK